MEIRASQAFSRCSLSFESPACFSPCFPHNIFHDNNTHLPTYSWRCSCISVYFLLWKVKECWGSTATKKTCLFWPMLGNVHLLIYFLSCLVYPLWMLVANHHKPDLDKVNCLLTLPAVHFALVACSVTCCQTDSLSIDILKQAQQAKPQNHFDFILKTWHDIFEEAMMQITIIFCIF